MKIGNKLLLALCLLGLGGCSKFKPTETVSAQLKCALCHGQPPTGLAHDSYALGKDCAVCHQGNSGLNGFTNVNTHDNGRIDVTACNVCHGTSPVTGAHLKHVVTYGKDCNLCHEGYSAKNFTAPEATHLNGKIEQGCSNIACHGQMRISDPAYPNGVVWSSLPVKFTDQLSCAGCHTVNKASHHSATGHTCATCHYKTMSTGSDSIIRDFSLHGNGIVDLIN